MAKLTLLDMVQEILSSLNGDEVNSYSDTAESNQIAQILKRKYYDIQTRGDVPEHKQLIQLTASGDTDKPVQMTIPSGVSNIYWIKYFDNNTDDSVSVPLYKYVTMLPLEQFLDYVNNFNTDEDNVESMTFTQGGFDYTFYYMTDRQPSCCTCISNQWVIFDSFDSEVDTTLQGSKTEVFAKKVPTFTMADSFVPELPDNEFSLLMNEAKALAFYELKQMPHPLADREIKRQWSAAQKNKEIFTKPTAFERLPSFGRRRGGYVGQSF